MNMLNKRDNRGFTMMETLIAVAIVVILLAVGFIALLNYQRTMKQLELDKTARELFVAAQNHLTAAESQGLLSTRDRTDENAVGVEGTRDGKTYRYFVVGSDEASQSLLDDTKSVLHDMLPHYSIDDTVRLGGSYVIEYNLESATVTNVFYSDMSQLSNHEFSSGDLESLFVNPDYVGSEQAKKTLRLDGFNEDRNAIIGWYGGDDVKDLARVKLYAPKVEIINAEKLEVKVSFTRDAIKRMVDTDAKICVILKGLTSGNERVVNPVPGSSNGTTVSAFNVDPKTYNEVDGVVPYRCHNYVLDDVTSQSDHFGNLWCTGDDALIPGEDIQVTVQVFSTSSLANVPIGVSGQTNSLFASIDVKDEVGTAGIANFRHLENLDPEISGYDPKTLQSEGAVPATKAKQLRNLAPGDSDSEKDYSWAGFKKAIDSANPDSVCVNKLDGGTDSASKAGTYMPVNPSYVSGSNTVHYLTSYDGSSYCIEGVTVDNAGNAGLFGALEGCEIKDLELQNFDVKTSNGSAGALVGEGKNLTITNVLVCNTVSDDSSYEIMGSGSTGGLIGSMSTSTVANSAAAVYVQSTGGCAGGLVGESKGSGSKLDKSYAGGHTVNGAYSTDATANAAGRLNVQAQVEVGGLVGKATDGLTIDSCYSTCSASGATAGGLVGSMNGGTISNSYATGLVMGTTNSATVGAFAGSLSSGASVNQADGKKSSYLSLVNLYDSTGAARNVSAIGSDASSIAVTAFDANANTYNAFAGSAGSAYPYDAYLKQNASNAYPFKNIQELSGASADTLPNHAKSHYGDWPVAEYLFVNTKE